MQCPDCGFENPEGTKFCEECGAKFSQVCPSCGHEIRPTAKFCGECGTVLTGKETGKRGNGESAKRSEKSSSLQTLNARRQTLDSSRPEAERRQLTVMFCDLVGSTALSEQLDPEELREVVRAYQETCASVIERYEGHIAQYLGDGLLVYFGYPNAHEDDAQRAVRAGLEIVEKIRTLVVPSSASAEEHRAATVRERVEIDRDRDRDRDGRTIRLLTRVALSSLQVRLGIHTGLVVVGEIGDRGKREQLALGDTPNIAARLQGLAEPDTLMISAATQRLIIGLFDCQDLGRQGLKGVSVPLQVYRVLSESNAQSRLEVDVSTGKLTPLVGRAHEVGLILERWTAAQAGDGQVVLFSGEPGIGKSRLMQEVKERVIQQGAMCLEFRCSPYAQNSAFSPVLVHLQQVLHWQREDSPQVRLDKLQQTLVGYRFPQGDTLPLLAALLSLPLPLDALPLNLSPQKQKQKTQEALVAWLAEEAERAPVYCTWEDLHWADPSTLELLGLLLDQVPTARLLVLLTARPEFTPPWSTRTHLTPLTLARLPRTQAGEMIEKVTGGKPLPAEVQHQIVNKTDGVPLFIEELTKMVLESGIVREQNGSYALTAPLPPLAIPTTLRDSLMARLDRLATGKEVAQVGATLGREFPYELIHAVAPGDEASLQHALTKLVEAEVLYQRGLPPQARYIFKHALIQDAAYQSLLKSRRQQYHQQIAQVLEERFVEITETQPELVAHHYTEAGLVGQAIPYWQRAGQRAIAHSANVEAIGHLTKGLEVLKSLPVTPKRTQQELTLQITLGVPLIHIKGYAAPEVERTYTRARELCQQVGETPQLFSALWGLWLFYVCGGGHRETARELGEQLLSLTQSVHDRAPLAHYALGCSLFLLGELTQSREHLERGIALYNPRWHGSYAFLYSQDPRVVCSTYAAWSPWCLGYPDQALKRNKDMLTFAQELSHPFSLAFALNFSAALHQFRGERQAAQERAEAAVALCAEQGFPFWLAPGTILQGWALAEQGQAEKGIAQIRQGLTSYRATGADLYLPHFLALLAEACGKGRRTEEGLSAVAEALDGVHQTGERYYEAELYRLKGELTLQKEARGWRLETSQGEPRGWGLEASPPSPPQSQASSPQSHISSLKPQVSREVAQEVEGYFLKAIDIACRQSAKSWELRAVMSLSRLRQQQGKKDEARQMLAEIYNWFTEGFDTKDLQEAKALLEELA